MPGVFWRGQEVEKGRPARRLKKQCHRGWQGGPELGQREEIRSLASLYFAGPFARVLMMLSQVSMHSIPGTGSMLRWSLHAGSTVSVRQQVGAWAWCGDKVHI